MTLTVLPDPQKLVSAFLRAQPEVAALVDDRVYTVRPNQATFPLVLVQRAGGAPLTSRPLWVDAPLLQIDAYGGTKPQANRIAETCRAALAERLRGDHGADGWVTDVRFGAVRDLPDPDEEPARPRYSFDVTVHLHP